MRAVVSGCWATISCYILEQHKKCNGLHTTNSLLHLSTGTSWNGKKQAVMQKKNKSPSEQNRSQQKMVIVMWQKNWSIKRHSCVEKRQISRKRSCACVKTNNHRTEKGTVQRKIRTVPYHTGRLQANLPYTGQQLRVCLMSDSWHETVTNNVKQQKPNGPVMAVVLTTEWTRVPSFCYFYCVVGVVVFI